MHTAPLERVPQPLLLWRAAELLVILRFRALVKVSAFSLKAPQDKGPSSVKARALALAPLQRCWVRRTLC
jgi:hypothetical protein